MVLMELTVHLPVKLQQSEVEAVVKVLQVQVASEDPEVVEPAVEQVEEDQVVQELLVKVMMEEQESVLILIMLEVEAEPEW
tara:strand:- start:317 stop:559 length:243 start_codon:yes stop_codon:yes gene_type:complete